MVAGWRAAIDDRLESSTAEKRENRKFHQRYVTWVREEATFVWVQCKFSFDVGRAKPQKINTQKIFQVPTSPTKPHNTV